MMDSTSSVGGDGGRLSWAGSAEGDSLRGSLTDIDAFVGGLDLEEQFDEALRTWQMTHPVLAGEGDDAEESATSEGSVDDDEWEPELSSHDPASFADDDFEGSSEGQSALRMSGRLAMRGAADEDAESVDLRAAGHGPLPRGGGVAAPAVGVARAREKARIAARAVKRILGHAGLGISTLVMGAVTLAFGLGNVAFAALKATGQILLTGWGYSAKSNLKEWKQEFFEMMSVTYFLASVTKQCALKSKRLGHEFKPKWPDLAKWRRDAAGG